MATNGSSSALISGLKKIARTTYKKPSEYSEHFATYRVCATLFNSVYAEMGITFLVFMAALANIGKAVGGSRMLDYIQYWVRPSADYSFLSEKSSEEMTVSYVGDRYVNKTFKTTSEEKERAWFRTNCRSVNPNNAADMRYIAELAAHFSFYEGGWDVVRALASVETEDEQGEALTVRVLDVPCEENGVKWVVAHHRMPVRRLSEAETARAESGASERDVLIKEIAAEMDKDVRIRRYWWFDFAVDMASEMSARAKLAA